MLSGRHLFYSILMKGFFMIWYKYLYADKSVRRQKAKIKWKIRHNAGMLDVYVITLSSNEGGLLEIISTIELMQKVYPKDRLFVVGIARGYEQARELACSIVMEVYERTGGFRVKDYLMQRQYMENEQVSL